VKFAWIATEKATFRVSELCRTLDVAPSGYDAWCRRPESPHAARDRHLKVLVRASFATSKQRYRSPRIHEDLLEQHERVSRKRVIRLMQEDGLKARVRKRFSCTAMSDHDQPVAANLLDRQFTAERPNQRWVGDTTEFVIGESGTLYLAAVLDLYSRFIVGGGDCYDNAVMESFFSTVKSELADWFDSFGEVKMELFDYIEVFYNQRRRHSTLGRISPAAFERRATAA
jgi:transposase InsO family protein